jgi:hypothetical protein
VTKKSKRFGSSANHNPKPKKTEKNSDLQAENPYFQHKDIKKGGKKKLRYSTCPQTSPTNLNNKSTFIPYTRTAVVEEGWELPRKEGAAKLNRLCCKWAKQADNGKEQMGPCSENGFDFERGD